MDVFMISKVGLAKGKKFSFDVIPGKTGIQDKETDFRPSPTDKDIPGPTLLRLDSGFHREDDFWGSPFSENIFLD
jgi:hypothetical protein